MNRPNFQPIFSSENEFCEVLDPKPVSNFVPNQSLSLRDLVYRFEHGQRLNVHENFAPMSNFTRDEVYQETFDEAPPIDVNDVVDVHNYYNEHENHKREFNNRQKEKQQSAKQASAKKASESDVVAPEPA